MDLTPGATQDQKRSDEVELTSFVTKMIGHQRGMARGLVAVTKGMELLASGYEALQLDVEQIRAEAYRAGREDAAKAIDDARAYPYIDVEKAKALARGQQPPQKPWQIRAAATGGGPCRTCGKPFWTHVCLSCSPDYQTPGPGCCNCRNTGMDQTPCQPARGSGDR